MDALLKKYAEKIDKEYRWGAIAYGGNERTKMKIKKHLRRFLIEYIEFKENKKEK